MSDSLKTLELKTNVYKRLIYSKIPIDEILTSDVFFSRKINSIGIYAYFYKKKYYIKCISPYKAEEETYSFTNEDDFVFLLLKLKIIDKVIREAGCKYKEYSLNLFILL